MWFPAPFDRFLLLGYNRENTCPGGIATPNFIYEADVAYSDLGPDQLLDHRGLLRILQEAAAFASDEVGYGIKDTARNGVLWILAGWRLELCARPAWRSHLTVRTWPRSMDGFVSERDFLIYSGETLVARATSRWFLVSAATGKVTRVTQAVRSAYDLDQRTLFEAPIPSNGKTPAGTPVAFATAAGRRDMDTNHHVNNIHYLDYALEALPEEVVQNFPSTVEIAFRRQILLGTPIRCFYCRTEDGRHQVEIQSGGEEEKVTHHAFVWFY